MITVTQKNPDLVAAAKQFYQSVRRHINDPNYGYSLSEIEHKLEESGLARHPWINQVMDFDAMLMVYRGMKMVGDRATLKITFKRKRDDGTYLVLEEIVKSK